MLLHVFVPNIEVRFVENFLVALLKRNSWFGFEGFRLFERLVVEFGGISG